MSDTYQSTGEIDFLGLRITGGMFISRNDRTLFPIVVKGPQGGLKARLFLSSREAEALARALLAGVAEARGELSKEGKAGA